MSPQRIHDKLISVLNRLIWVEETLAPSLRHGDTVRLERLEHLQETLAGELTQLMDLYPSLPANLAASVRGKVEVLRHVRDANTRLVAETRGLCERFFGSEGGAGYLADGRPAGRERRTFVRLTA